MRYGIFPVVLVFVALCFRALARARHTGVLSLRDPRFAGFVTAAALTLVGFVLGALIRGSNTLVPAHYHAAIGAVTTSFMAVTFLLLPSLSARTPAPRWRALACWQPLLFGGGQLLMVLGFALAGAHGAARKAYGVEQASRTLAEGAGFAVMGVGGLVAIMGGVLFLTLVVPALFRPHLPAAAGALTWRSPWVPISLASIRSRS
jgi:hypothetical protein